jgi:hypothetical protein
MLQMKPKLALAMMLLVAACSSGSSTQSGNMETLLLRLEQRGTIFFGSGYTAPANLQIDLTNVSNEPVKLVRVGLSTPGMAQYSLQPISRTFNEEIAPKETKSYPLFGTAQTSIYRLRVSEPLVARVIVELEQGGKRFREIAIVYADSELTR